MTHTDLADLMNSLDDSEVAANYNDLSDMQMMQKYGLSHGNYREFKKHFNLRRSKEYSNNKLKNYYKKKETSIENQVRKLMDSISREKFYDIYIAKNSSVSETASCLGIREIDVLRLIRAYDLRKPRKLSHEIGKKTKLARYGDPEYRNPEKARATCILRYGIDNPFKDVDSMRNSYINALGVDHPMRCPDIFRKQQETSLKNWLKGNSSGPHGINSSYNIRFSELCESLGLSESYTVFDNAHFSREFCIGRMSFDFRIGNFLIEINPYATHNSTWNPFGNEKSEDYHRKKSCLAWENGFYCIHVWDWDVPECVLDKILNNSFSGMDLDKSLYTGDISKISPNIYLYDYKKRILVDEKNTNTVEIYGVGKVV